MRYPLCPQWVESCHQELVLNKKFGNGLSRDGLLQSFAGFLHT